MTTSTPEKQEGIALLQTAIERVEEVIKKCGGSFNVIMEVSLPFSVHFLNFIV